MTEKTRVNKTTGPDERNNDRGLSDVPLVAGDEAPPANAPVASPPAESPSPATGQSCLTLPRAAGQTGMTEGNGRATGQTGTPHEIRRLPTEVVITVPIGRPAPASYVPTHVDVGALSRRQGLALQHVFVGLWERNTPTAPNRGVISHAAAVRWLLERIADGLGIG